MATPTTSWIRDSGSTITPNTGILVDELSNTFIDEFGNNLLDSVSTDGEVLAHAWNTIAENNTSWADAFEARVSEVARATIQGDIRTTVQGDTRTALVSDPNIQNTTSWSQDEY